MVILFSSVMMAIIQVDDFIVQVVRSRRKTVALHVSIDGATIRIPLKFPLTEAEAFVRKKSSWIKQKLTLADAVPVRSFSSGSLHAYLGEAYPLVHIVSTGRAVIRFNDEQFQLHAAAMPDTAAVRILLMRCYRKAAADYLAQRTLLLADKTGLHPTKISVRQYKSRWGSCNARGELQLNWQLIQAPVEIVDYVIIHELCHLKQLNHSPAFWLQVSQYYPDYRGARQWFKANGAGLLF